MAHYAHAAGVSGHAPLAEMTGAQLDTVLAPKARPNIDVRASGANMALLALPYEQQVAALPKQLCFTKRPKFAFTQL